MIPEGVELGGYSEQSDDLRPWKTLGLLKFRTLTRR